MELCINIVWFMHSKSLLCAISLKCFYGYIILFLDFELTPLECPVDGFIRHEMCSSSTTLLFKNYSKCLAQVLVAFTLTNHKEGFEKLLSSGKAIRFHPSNAGIYDALGGMNWDALICYPPVLK